MLLTYSITEKHAMHRAIDKKCSSRVQGQGKVIRPCTVYTYTVLNELFAVN